MKSVLRAITAPLMQQARYFRIMQQPGMSFWCVRMTRDLRKKVKEAALSDYCEFLSYLEDEEQGKGPEFGPCPCCEETAQSQDGYPLASNPDLGAW